MQAFVRKDKRDVHQASVHKSSSKTKSHCPQCEASVERYWFGINYFICYPGTIYPSTSCGSTREASSAQLQLSPCALIVARHGPAVVSRVTSPLSTSTAVSGSSSALTGILYSHVILSYLSSNQYIFSIAIVDQTERNPASTWITVTLEIQISVLSIASVDILMDALLFFSEWRSLDWCPNQVDVISWTQLHLVRIVSTDNWYRNVKCMYCC